MRAVQTTHAASGAQRSDRAAFIRSSCAGVEHYLRERMRVYSFSLSLTPAHGRDAEIWHAKHRCGAGSGGRFCGSGTVLWCRTSKSLKRRHNCAGSMVLSISASRDVCRHARVCTRTCARVQNHRTIELHLICQCIEGVTGSIAVLCRFCAARLWRRRSMGWRGAGTLPCGSNKLAGGYGRWSLDRADLRLFGGDGREKFWGSSSGAAVDRARIGERRDLVEGAGRNGGNLRVSEGAQGCVGMVASEWSRKSEHDQRSSGIEPKLSQLSRASGRPGGSIDQAEGAAPPAGLARVPCTLAQGLIRISVAPDHVADNKLAVRAQEFDWKRGSGVRVLARGRSAGGVARGRGHGQACNRGRGHGWSILPRRNGAELQTLWAGGARVN